MPVQVVPTQFRSFYGRNIEQMPLLLSGKNAEDKQVDIERVPMTAYQLLNERAYGENEHDRNLLRNNYVDTADVLITNPRDTGEVVVAHYANPLVQRLVTSLNPKSSVKNYGLIVDVDTYEAIKADKNNSFVLHKNIANELRRDCYSNQKSREAFWEFVALGNQNIVKENLTLVQQANGGTMSNRMGLWLSKFSGLRLLCVGSVGSNSSFAYGYFSIYNYDGRLVGVAPVALVAQKNGALQTNGVLGSPYREPGVVSDPLEQRVRIALEAGTAFEYNGKLYAPLDAGNLQLKK